MSFQSLGLCTELLNAITTQGYTTPTPIQLQAIPVIFKGLDLLAGAQTGTGKTAAFALPIVQMLSETTPIKKRRSPRALILVPTRELAAQVSEQMQNYGRRLSLRSTMIYGGVSIQAQIERLHRGIDIVVATPGRLLDHLTRGTIKLSDIQCLVLDEADRMLDLGFIDAIIEISKYLPTERQSLLFSATYSQKIKQLASELLINPKRIEVARRNIAADDIDQVIYPVERSRKRDMISHLIRKGEWNQVLVFARTRYSADKLTAELLFDGIQTAAIHSNKSQSVRTRTLKQFKQGELQVLVATDVASRGLDIARLPYVVNYELPDIPEDYIHRIGRTGRAGESGRALSLVCHAEQPKLQAIEKLLKMTIPRKAIEEFPQIPIRRGALKKPRKETTRSPHAKNVAAKEKTNSNRKRTSTKKVKKVQKSTKSRTVGRKKSPHRQTAPKTGRRGSRS
ncbi:DEAD/DEAH box helicase [uncultured Desulfuromusa sp.]|uniref:DEAD/DEAH box helicase n=1 Tax=uncultured Desulfuromusa sp. TaxID=219183 RepID=UPI002AA672B8|nr:DEAD/DEAH box helicase [uncultured Desulfuromusa sp.]